MEMEKLIIAGAGPAGVSAALYAVRSGITPLVLHKGGGALEKAVKNRKLLWSSPAGLRSRTVSERAGTAEIFSGPCHGRRTAGRRI